MISALDQCSQVIDLAGMIEIMGDHDPDNVAGRQAFAPIGKALTVQFGLRVVDATGDIPSQQKTVRRMVHEMLRGYQGPFGSERAAER